MFHLIQNPLAPWWRSHQCRNTLALHFHVQRYCNLPCFPLTHRLWYSCSCILLVADAVLIHFQYVTTEFFWPFWISWWDSDDPIYQEESIDITVYSMNNDCWIASFDFQMCSLFLRRIMYWVSAKFPRMQWNLKEVIFRWLIRLGWIPNDGAHECWQWTLG